jgi:hypothetical protein
MIATQLHLVPRLRIVQLYFQSPYTLVAWRLIIYAQENYFTATSNNKKWKLQEELVRPVTKSAALYRHTDTIIAHSIFKVLLYVYIETHNLK